MHKLLLNANFTTMFFCSSPLHSLIFIQNKSYTPMRKQLNTIRVLTNTMYDCTFSENGHSGAAESHSPVMLILFTSTLAQKERC